MLFKRLKIDRSNRVYYDSGCLNIDFFSDFVFLECFIFEKEKIILAIGDLSNDDCGFLGKFYSYDGTLIMVLPFPKGGNLSNLGISIHYRWASETNNGIKFTFGTSSHLYSDFWYDFNIDLMEYTETGDLFC